MVDIQLKARTELTFNRIGAEQRDTILQAGLALQQAGVIAANVEVAKALDGLIDDRFVTVSSRADPWLPRSVAAGAVVQRVVGALHSRRPACLLSA